MIFQDLCVSFSLAMSSTFKVSQPFPPTMKNPIPSDASRAPARNPGEAVPWSTKAMEVFWSKYFGGWRKKNTLDFS